MMAAGETFELPVGSALFHYTRAEVALKHIVGSGLRFSSLERMRDPLEAKDWPFAWYGRYGVTGGMEVVDTPLHMRAEMKRRLKIVSLTNEEPGRQLAEPWDWVYRGYARPRLWEQYAENHAGVCLVFYRDHLTYSFEYELRQPEILWRAHGPVDYERWARHGRDLGSSIYPYEDPLFLRASMTSSVEEACVEHLAQHAPELLFTKLPDWSTEQEYRYAIFDAAEEDRYLNAGLAAIILGDRFADEHSALAAAAAEACGCPLYKLQWAADEEAAWTSSFAAAAGYVDYLQARVVRVQ